MKKLKYLFILLTLLFIMESFAFADETNSICVYKLVNEGSKNFVLPTTGSKVQPNLFKDYGIKPIVGSKISIYKVDKDKKEYYDKLKLEKLGKAHAEGLTNSEGKVCFTGLDDGLYYIRDNSNDKYVANSALISLPFKYDGEVKKDVEIYLKSYLPDNPPDTPPDNPPDNPPGTPPKTPPDNPPQIPPKNPPDNPKIPPLGRHFIKTDNRTDPNPLEGATFKVVRKVDDKYEPVLKDGKEYVISSDKNGEFEVLGIEKGEYYLVETIAPKDENYQYKLLKEPLKFEINELSMGDTPIHVVNAPLETVKTTPPDNPKSPNSPNSPSTPKTTEKIHIPKTGDIQIILYIASGAVVFTLGLYIYIIDDRKRKLWN